MKYSKCLKCGKRTIRKNNLCFNCDDSVLRCPVCEKKLGSRNTTGYCHKHRHFSNKRKQSRKKCYDKNIEKNRARDKERYLKDENRKCQIIQRNKNNREKINKRRRELRKENPEKHRQKDRERSQKESRKEWKKQYNKKRRRNDPIFKFKKNIGSAFSRFLRENNKSFFEITNFNIDEYMTILKKRFKIDYPNLNFERCFLSCSYHIDHIIPIKIAKNDKEVVKLFSPLNLRLITSKENLAKQDNIILEEIKKYGIYEMYKEVLKGENICL